MRTCQYCGATGEDGIIARHEQACRYMKRTGPVEMESSSPFQGPQGTPTEPEAETQEFICPKCGKTCKSALGLSSHFKSCKGE